MKRIIASLVALTLAGAAQAQTVWEAGAGVSIAQAQHDGIWYQARFPHRLNLTNPAIELGTRTTLADHWSVVTRAFYLGRVNSSALATTNDADYDPHSPTGCAGTCPRLATFNGQGTVSRLSAMLEWHTAGAWQWGFAVGPVLYRESWTMDVPDWYPSEHGQATGPVQPVHISATQWKLRPRWALRLTHDNWYVAATYARDAADLDPLRYFPPVWKSHTVLIIGHSF